MKCPKKKTKHACKWYGTDNCAKDPCTQELMKVKKVKKKPKAGISKLKINAGKSYFNSTFSRNSVP